MVVISVWVCLIALIVTYGIYGVVSERRERAENEAEASETYDENLILSTPFYELGFDNFEGIELIEIDGYQDDYVYGFLADDDLSTNGVIFSGESFDNKFDMIRYGSIKDIKLDRSQTISSTPYKSIGNNYAEYGDDGLLNIEERRLIDTNRVVFVIWWDGWETFYVPKCLLDCSKAENYSFNDRRITEYEVPEEKGFKIPWKK